MQAKARKAECKINHLKVYDENIKVHPLCIVRHPNHADIPILVVLIMRFQHAIKTKKHYTFQEKTLYLYIETKRRLVYETME